jgi:hypothetical protein
MEAKTEYPGRYDAPRGYVIYCNHQAGNNALELEITLAGRCRRFFPVVFKSLHQGGQRGVGFARVQYCIREVRALERDGTWSLVEDLDHPLPRLGVGTVHSCKDRFEIRTPVRMRRMGRYLNTMDWSFFFQVLARRMEALQCLYCDGHPLGREKWQGLLTGMGAFGRITDKVLWKDFYRYSNRQKKKVPMGGLVGQVDISQAEPWVAPWMLAAQALHLGKGAAMGFGRVESVS